MASFQVYQTNLVAANYYSVLAYCESCNYEVINCICCGYTCKYCTLDCVICNCDFCQECGTLDSKCNCQELICKICHEDKEYSCNCYCRNCDYIAKECICRRHRYNLSDPAWNSFINFAYCQRKYEQGIARSDLSNLGYS
jgi:hypothetical protein